MDGWMGLDLRVGGGIEHLTVLIMHISDVNLQRKIFDSCIHPPVKTLVTM